ncbi:thiamine ABC transporter substrate binding subunit [Tolumonas lignilytica]|uniref:thiamine ABC transporter substrate binding subunit n=1 Tax=Tolumonas lignilytica TaxID=1283284 RepID=UPI0004679772|nr:thiamine ABC transporter substrate binding subunit [Tolumonas lignilytica]
MRHFGSWLLTAVLLTGSTLVQAAESKPVLTVYTYDSFASDWGPGPKVKQAFEAECQCELKWVALEDGVAILNRLKLEGAHTKADVALGMDEGMLADARNSQLFTAHHADLKSLSLPGGWHDETFLPFDYGYFAFVYDGNKLQHPPQSLKELVSRNDLKIIYEDPRTSTPGQGLLMWVKEVYGDQAPAAWEQLAKKTLTVTKGWSEAYGMFLKGQADLVLSYTTSPAYHRLAENKQQYHAAMFSEGHLRQVEVAAQLKNAQQPQLAQQFMQFLLTDRFQKLIPEGNWMYPVTNIPLPDGFNQHETPAKTLQIDPQKLGERKRWIKEWLQAVSH